MHKCWWTSHRAPSRSLLRKACTMWARNFHTIFVNNRYEYITQTQNKHLTLRVCSSHKAEASCYDSLIIIGTNLKYEYVWSNLIISYNFKNWVSGSYINLKVRSYKCIAHPKLLFTFKNKGKNNDRRLHEIKLQNSFHEMVPWGTFHKSHIWRKNIRYYYYY